MSVRTWSFVKQSIREPPNPGSAGNPIESEMFLALEHFDAPPVF
jgi:hypothetical protein